MEDRLVREQEADCARRLFMAKWPHGIQCPRCAQRDFYTIRSRKFALYECRACGHQTTLTAGTVMEGSRTPLRKWFQAIQYLSTGISATRLHKLIGVTYKTAWLMNHKLRRAIQEADGKWQIAGQVHVKGIFYGEQRFHASVHFHKREQPLLAGASLDSKGNLSQVKIKKVNKATLRTRSIDRRAGQAFLNQHVHSSDRPQAVCTLHRYGSTQFFPLVAVCHQAFQWLNATFCGIGSKHLQAYLDEYSFRINQAAQSNSFFAHLLQLSATTRRTTYPCLIRDLLSEAPLQIAVAA
ncbi:transposase [Cohnella nanjingensis]|uniref:Transposase n=1 Tax=Cohnella nanjingensis TaxID=1387779 RepID=A0A7X0RP54_9BACL|nr:transposase [Cohnella nanjingensis]MBB6671102.1 transposase [Cohnella nanjingensis]